MQQEHEGRIVGASGECIENHARRGLDPAYINHQNL